MRAALHPVAPPLHTARGVIIRTLSALLAAIMVVVVFDAAPVSASDYGRQSRPPRGGGGGGGGIGVGIGVGIGIGLLQGLAAQERAQERERRRERRIRRRTVVKVTCARGSVRRGKCYCRSGWTRKRLRRNRYKCIRIPKVAAPKPDSRCRGGTYRRNRCVCPDGLVRRRVGSNRYVCPPDKTVVVITTPPPTVKPPVKTTTPASRPPSGPVRRAGASPIPPIAAGQTIPNFVADEVLVSLPITTALAVDEQIAQTYGATLLERLPLDLIGERIVRYRIAGNSTVPGTVAAMQADPRVSGSQANYLYRNRGDKTRAASPEELQYALIKVNARPAQKLATGRNVVLAVIDTGIESSHPDLNQSIEKHFNALATKTAKPDPHGTAIAGIIAGQGLVQGIAPRARILDVQAFEAGVAGGPTLTTSFILLRAVDWSLKQKAKILNLSFAGPRDPVFEKAVRATSDKNVIMVAAAGNGGSTAKPAYPAAYREVIAVTATDERDRLYQKANHGPYIAVAAPGVDILTPTVGGAHDLQTGTSFAAAHVSAIIALMLERNPRLTTTAAVNALTKAANDLGPPGRDEQFGAGRTNALESLQLVPARSAEPLRRTAFQ